MPFVIAFAIAMLIEPIIKYVHKRTKLPRKTSAIIVLIIVSAILIGIIAWGIITLASEAYNMLGGINEYSEKIYSQFQSLIQNINLDKINMSDKITEIMQNSMQDIITNISKMISNILNSGIKWITTLPTIGIYIAVT